MIGFYHIKYNIYNGVRINGNKIFYTEITCRKVSLNIYD